MTPQSFQEPLFDTLYERISQDLMQVEDSGFGTTEHRDKILSLVASSKAFASAGPRTQLKQWLSWVGATHRLLKHWHTTLLCVSYQQVRNGDCTIDALPLFGFPKKPGVAAAEEKGAEDECDDGAKDDGDAEVVAVEDADSENEAVGRERKVDRDSCKNTLQYVSFLLADVHRNRMIKIVCHASTPQYGRATTWRTRSCVQRKT